MQHFSWIAINCQPAMVSEIRSKAVSFSVEVQTLNFLLTGYVFSSDKKKCRPFASFFLLFFNLQRLRDE